MIAYVGKHWRGELSLAQSYWVNGLLLSFLAGVGATLLEGPLSEQRLYDAVAFGLGLIAALSVVTVWQFVGIWRSATNTSSRTGRVLWPRVAKFLVVVGTLSAAANIVTAATDSLKALAALEDETLAAYTVERRGETDLILTGALNDDSVDEVLHALEDPAIRILRVNSHGGLIAPAIRLAEHIRDDEVMVMAEGQCVSACVMLLAASPYAAIWPGTEVTFHRAEPVAEFTNPDVRRQSAAFLAEADATLRDFGVADWALETAGRQEYWTPTLEQQVRMGLIGFVFDPDRMTFARAADYCARHPARCAGRQNGSLQTSSVANGK